MVIEHDRTYDLSDRYVSSISSRSTGMSPGSTGGSPFSSMTSSARASPGSRVLKIVTEMGSSNVSGISAAMGADAANSLIQSRDREKKDLQDLNDRLATYIERVRFLEAQNRKLAEDLEELRGRWGKDTNGVKVMYAGELSEARKLMDASAKEKADAEIQVGRLGDELNDIRTRFEDALRQRTADKDNIDQFTNQLSDAETEISMLQRRLTGLTEECDKFTKDNDRIASDLTKARNDLDSERVNRIDYQNQAQTLLEEIEFLRRIHDQEMKELEALASRDGPRDNKDYFKNELALAIRDIRNEYDIIAGQNKTDMESWYKLKVQEVQSSTGAVSAETTYQKDEVRRMRAQLGDSRGKMADLENRNAMLEKQAQELNYQLSDDQRQFESALNDRDAQIRKMREECQALMVELQLLMDTKQILDAEIAIYRKMLEGEENRAGLKSLVEQVVKSHSLQTNEDLESSRKIRGESSTQTTFQRTSKGNVCVGDVDPAGKFIILENTHRTKDESISSWRIKRKIDGRREISYTLPAGFVLKASADVKIWAKDQGGSHSPPQNLIFDGDTTWGSGHNVQTLVYNEAGEEKATHIQRSVQI